MTATLQTELEKRVAAMNAEREAREASIRRDAAAESEARVRTSMEEQVVVLTSERDKGAARLKLVESANARESSLRIEAEKQLVAFKSETEARESAIRKEVTAQTEARLNAVTQQQVLAITGERDQHAAKVKALEAEGAKQKAERDSRDVQIRKEVTAQTEARLKAESDQRLAAVLAERDESLVKVKALEAEGAKHKQDLDQMRQALEKDRSDQLLKLQAEHQREKGQLQQKVDTLSRQLQRKTSDELGEGAELDVYGALREAFAGDDITRVKRGEPGADIRHNVLHKGTACGSIVIDSKNRLAWQHSYVTKLREDQMAAKAEHAVLATTAFPSGKKELYIDDETGVIVVSRARVCEIVELLRTEMVSTHALKLSLSERNEKRDLLYKYIVSDEYRQHQREAARLTGELSDLDVEEQREHQRVWLKRGKMVAGLRNVVRQVETEVSAIMEKVSSPVGEA